VWLGQSERSEEDAASSLLLHGYSMCCTLGSSRSSERERSLEPERFRDRIPNLTVSITLIFGDTNLLEDSRKDNDLQ